MCPRKSDNIQSNLVSKISGSIFGLAIGDSLGAPVECNDPGTFSPVTGFRSGGPFNLPAGTWTDDTSLALCLAESLAICRGFNPTDQVSRYIRWYRDGHLSATGQCFDIGNTTRQALMKFVETGESFPGPTHERSMSNGSLMRLAPVPLFYHDRPDAALVFAGESSRTTHGHPAAISACQYLAGLLWGAINGVSKDELLSPLYSPVPGFWERNPLHPAIREVAEGSFWQRDPPYIKGTGYVVESLEAALWAFAKGSDFRESVLLAVNLGDDADTTGAICGQLAGAYYGMDEIPEEWIHGLVKEELLLRAANGIHLASYREPVQ
jgi:ADP-ribosylglycohydrolase